MVDGSRIAANKPVELKQNAVFCIGPSKTHSFKVTMSSSNELKDKKETNKEKKVRASHLLVKHKDSRRPSSWKEEHITRSQEEALQMVERYRAMIENGQVEFGVLASTESDCSSAKRGGDLGWFGKGEMQKAFEDATYALQIGEMSTPVFSSSGIHIILRTG